MELLHKAEARVAAIAKEVPHLPIGWRAWLGQNIWWIVATIAGIGAVGVLIGLVQLTQALNALNTLSAYLSVGSISSWVTTVNGINLAFVAIQFVALGLAIQPLKAQKRKGWQLLFIGLLINALGIVTVAILRLDVMVFITSLIFGAILCGAYAYILFEIRDQFKGVERKEGAHAVDPLSPKRK